MAFIEVRLLEDRNADGCGAIVQTEAAALRLEQLGDEIPHARKCIDAELIVDV